MREYSCKSVSKAASMIGLTSSQPRKSYHLSHLSLYSSTNRLEFVAVLIISMQLFGVGAEITHLPEHIDISAPKER